MLVHNEGRTVVPAIARLV